MKIRDFPDAQLVLSGERTIPGSHLEIKNQASADKLPYVRGDIKKF